MNYIYDIYLNFHKTYYDFYEWQQDDRIIHVKKIPIIKVNTQTLRKLMSHRFIIDDKTLNFIKNKTEIYNQKEHLNCLVITDTKNIIAIKFNARGESIGTSSLLLEDEFEVLQFSLKAKEIETKYKLLNKNKYPLLTRKESKEKNFVLNKLHQLSYDTLKYIYYDYFNKEETDTKIILQTLMKEINNNNLINTYIYNILKPVSTK